MSKEKNIDTLLLDGGCHCFNFINTVHSRTEELSYDYLQTYDDLLKWSEKVKLLPNERIKRLKVLARKNEKAAEKKLVDIKNKRELLFNIFSSIINKDKFDNSLVEEFNNTLSQALSNLAFEFNSGEINLSWKKSDVDLMEPLWVIFKNAFDILTSISQKRLKACKSCGWLFLDNSKNNSRTWCNMQTCGSIDKSKRYYHRKKAKV